MIESVRQLFNKYGGFAGRTTRTELAIAKFFLTPVLAGLLWFRFYVSELPIWENGGLFVLLDFLVWGTQWALILAFGYVSLSYSVRRFHDINLSGANYVALAIACMIPLARYLAFATILMFYLMPPVDKDNNYGPNPRDVRPKPVNPTEGLRTAER